jgi:DNA ligase-associated metallophosphoesterase
MNSDIVNTRQQVLKHSNSYCLTINESQVWLLPDKALFIEESQSLLVSDVHLGKPETFQAFGIPVSSAVNRDTLSCLQALCQRLSPEHIFILGDLFHSSLALVEDVIEPWVEFVSSVEADIHLIVGNHDRPMIGDLENLLMQCHPDAVDIGSFRLSHEPEPLGLDNHLPSSRPRLNICGHVHPCVRLRTRLDDLRLPCFYFEESANRLILPSFGQFTGGFEVQLDRRTHAYAIAENTIIPFEGR